MVASPIIGLAPNTEKSWTLIFILGNWHGVLKLNFILQLNSPFPSVLPICVSVSFPISDPVPVAEESITHLTKISTAFLIGFNGILKVSQTINLTSYSYGSLSTSNAGGIRRDTSNGRTSTNISN